MLHKNKGHNPAVYRGEKTQTKFSISTDGDHSESDKCSVDPDQDSPSGF